MTNVYIWMSISSHTEAIGHQPTIDAQIAPWAVGSEWDELHLSWKKTLLPHDVIWNGELFGQWKSAVLILLPTSTSLRKLNQPLLCTTLLRNNKKHRCVINIFFLLKWKHSIIPDATKKKKNNSVPGGTTYRQICIYSQGCLFPRAESSICYCYPLCGYGKR